MYEKSRPGSGAGFFVDDKSWESTLRSNFADRKG